MMSPETIRSMSAKAARESAARGVSPLLFEQDDLDTEEAMLQHTRSIPFIGDRVPRGWKLVEASKLEACQRHDGCLTPWHDVTSPARPARSMLMVDSSGFGSESEPALTQGAFIDLLRAIGPGYAYAIMEQGQFQVVVGIFQRKN